VVWVVDRGMTSDDNLRQLLRGGGRHIAGEKMRAGKPLVEMALSRPGRYQRVADSLDVKEVVVGEGEARRRYVVVRNLAQVARSGGARPQTQAGRGGALTAAQWWRGTHQGGVRPAYPPEPGRYVKLDRRSRPVIDRAKLKVEARLDGKYLLITSDTTVGESPHRGG
jgi:hypothetical protein